ncbi:SDR family NAD(P)-dependent oxidoreductase [Halieaceae bacterium IMCC14734]|uniref:SDR family NAD(P)-dependent oxidoreductase n=1 Tax=Candidatus Litorirhabdus singularis TaxID=2518993 RepID=A0ABT3TFK4_9GAMM|nr:SDR family NAD(P)-dependent oxidoreductase [Candidatus Litorirhabdus singularis]MCX2981081.1 SDR family NAD(P)-dependent oxidoreductase [Candidatus Litorirhabdus singularis]
MTTLNETITLSRPVQEVFAYVADFSTCPEWDATAISAKRLDHAPLGLGSRWEVVCELPVGSITLEYSVTRFEPDSCIVLLGKSRFFDVEDTITVAPSKGGCTLEYTAEFRFPQPLRPVVKTFSAGLEHMGHQAVQVGLKQALDNDFPTPRLSKANSRADRFLPSALSLFTKRGYRRGSKHWNPVSAYMGDSHVVITGATAGLGKATAEAMARKHAHLTLVVRDSARGAELVDELKTTTGNQNIALEIADLSLMADVDALVKRLITGKKPIDVLVNNAGALFNPRKVTSEGLEQSFALLLLSPFRLTEGLYPLLAKSGGGRVINVVSGGMYSQKVQVDDLQNEVGKYSGSAAYARAKRALMIKTEQWAEDWADDNIVVNAMHPGWADTPGVQSALPEFRALTRPFLRSAEEGADTIVWLSCATEADALSGHLFLDREPRTTHLMSATKESADEREQLRTLLDNDDWDTSLDKAS